MYLSWQMLYHGSLTRCSLIYSNWRRGMIKRLSPWKLKTAILNNQIKKWMKFNFSWIWWFHIELRWNLHLSKLTTVRSMMFVYWYIKTRKLRCRLLSWTLPIINQTSAKSTGKIICQLNFISSDNFDCVYAIKYDFQTSNHWAKADWNRLGYTQCNLRQAY